jgi:hypothetical protein
VELGGWLALMQQGEEQRNNYICVLYGCRYRNSQSEGGMCLTADENFPEKFKSDNFPKIFPFFIRTVDMVSLFTFYTVIIMLIYTSPFILIGR